MLFKLLFIFYIFMNLISIKYIAKRLVKGYDKSDIKGLIGQPAEVLFFTFLIVGGLTTVPSIWLYLLVAKFSVTLAWLSALQILLAIMNIFLSLGKSASVSDGTYKPNSIWWSLFNLSVDAVYTVLIIQYLLR